MTTRSNAPENLTGLGALLNPLRQALQNPVIAGIALIVYLIVSYVILSSLSRQDPLFPLKSTLAFPPLVLFPFLVIGARLDGRFKALLILAVLFVVIPLIGMYDSSYFELVIQICIFAGLALGLNIVVGFAGLLDLGYVAFFAVGAYLWAMYTSNADTWFKINGLLVPASSFYLFLFFGIIVAAIGGVLLGLPVLRLRGDYLAIVTLGFGEVIRILANNANSPTNFTNGSQGLAGVARPQTLPFITDLIVRVESALGIPVNNAQALSQQALFYLIAILLVAAIILIARRLDNSPIGRAWTAIREDEVAAIAMGVPLVRMKLLAFAMGASFAGIIGVLYAAKQSFVSPESFSLNQSIGILAMVIVGGIGGIRGALFGACVVTLLNLQVLKNFSLQINNWKNIDAVIPSWLVALLVFAVVGYVLFLVVRALTPLLIRLAQRLNQNLSAQQIRVIVLVPLLIVVGINALQMPSFRFDDWPTQLEPAKYERLVFGVLLVMMMIFRPSGLLPEPRRKMELQESNATQAAAPVDGGKE
jgi:branched-chain amino acid transport system permease protein